MKELFPLKGYVTEEIIKKAKLMDAEKCVGALTLKAALNSSLYKVAWGVYYGVCSGVSVTTTEKFNMPRITKPQEVIFILENEPSFK